VIGKKIWAILKGKVKILSTAAQLLGLQNKFDVLAAWGAKFKKCYPPQIPHHPKKR